MAGFQARQSMLSQSMLFFKTHKDLLFGLGMLALFLVGLGMIIAFTGWQETWASLTKLSWGQLAILLALSLGNYVLRALRWHVLQ